MDVRSICIWIFLLRFSIVVSHPPELSFRFNLYNFEIVSLSKEEWQTFGIVGHQQPLPDTGIYCKHLLLTWNARRSVIGKSGRLLSWPGETWHAAATKPKIVSFSIKDYHCKHYLRLMHVSSAMDRSDPQSSRDFRSCRTLYSSCRSCMYRIESTQMPAGPVYTIRPMREPPWFSERNKVL